MHHTSPIKSGLGYMPSMYSFTDLTGLPEMVLDFGLPSTSDHVQRETLSKTSWEKRCLRKHRRRADDNGCSAKRRRLMADAGADSLGSCAPSPGHTWPPADGSLSLSLQASNSAHVEPRHSAEDLPKLSSTLSRPETDGSCMEVEAAQRRLREIEDRIQVDDDDEDEDEDLDVEPDPRRPVLVLSDSLKEGLKRGISDILPHTLTQSVSHSCMELVLWRPPGDALSQRLKDSLLRQRKQQTPCRQPPTPCPSSLPHSPLSPASPPGDAYSPLYSFPAEHSSGEEDMEL